MIRGQNTQRHLAESRELQAQPYIDLVELRLNPTTMVRITNSPSLFWGGYLWETYPHELTGVAAHTSGEANRPQLRLANLRRVLSLAVASGQIYQGTVTRYRVLEQDLATGAATCYLRNVWDISKVVNLNKDYAVIELRSPLDRQDYTLPARQFFPPEFPYVKLG